MDRDAGEGTGGASNPYLLARGAGGARVPPIGER